jgi:high-affinity Fe2+/Pb2+ permease
MNSNNITKTIQQENWIENLARLGMAAKGVIYCIIGVLATMAAFNVGGQTGGSKNAIQFIAQQPFGKILLGIVALGLIGYVVWRFYQAFEDPENKGKDKEGIGKRIGYAISGVVYGFLAYYAISLLFMSGGSSGGSGGKQELVGKILSQPFGQWVIGIVAVVLFGKALWQFYMAFTGKFADKVKEQELDHRAKEVIHKAGVVGYIARGIVVGIIAYSFLRAAIEANPSQAQGTEGAFQFLSNSDFGPYLLGIVAIGLVCYGVYMLIRARYRDMSAV